MPGAAALAAATARREQRATRPGRPGLLDAAAVGAPADCARVGLCRWTEMPVAVVVDVRSAGGRWLLGIRMGRSVRLHGDDADDDGVRGIKYLYPRRLRRRPRGFRSAARVRPA